MVYIVLLANLVVAAPQYSLCSLSLSLANNWGPQTLHLCSPGTTDTKRRRLQRFIGHKFKTPLPTLQKAVQSVGASARLQRFADRLLSGDALGVGVVGGSISTGEGDKSRGDKPNGCAALSTALGTQQAPRDAELSHRDAPTLNFFSLRPKSRPQHCLSPLSWKSTLWQTWTSAWGPLWVPLLQVCRALFLVA